MSSLADRTISALRSVHDELIGVVAGLSSEDLEARSGATEWSVAQVLSHLGSGAEIGRATLAAALGAAPAAPAADFNQGVWDRWNALPARDQADEFVSADERLVGAFEALDVAGARPLGHAAQRHGRIGCICESSAASARFVSHGVCAAVGQRPDPTDAANDGPS